MKALVLSIFPGIGLLDRAFEEEGFCIVRGPDLLWGGNIKRFHPPPGKFAGVLGGPPCQAHSQLAPLVLHNGYKLAEDLIPEFVRVVAEAQPDWFLMENVRRAPVAEVPGYRVHAPLFNNRWIGGIQSRLHRFSFGTRQGLRLETGAEQKIFAHIDFHPRVLARGGWTPLLDRGHRKKKGVSRVNTRSGVFFRKACELQGLPADFDLPGFTLEGKISALGNAVPLPMGRAIARCVRRALEAVPEATAPIPFIAEDSDAPAS